MSDEDYVKNIGLVGSFTLLYSAITGPGLVVIPQVYQQAGWLITTLVLFVVGALSTLASLLLIESLSKYPENAAFSRPIEMTTMVLHFYGVQWHNVMQFTLYGTLEINILTSIVVSAQTLDNFLVVVAGQTCGFTLSPTFGWECANQISYSASPFTSTMLFTYGYLFLIGIIFPMALLDFNDNAVIQFLSFLVVISIFGFWCVYFPVQGLQYKIPVAGSNLSQLVGNTILNFGFVTTVPSWIAVKHPRASIHKSIVYAVVNAILSYILLGIIGGSYVRYSDGDSVLSVGQNQTVNFLFPFFSLITSIPVNVIVVRANLIQAKVCGRGWAMFLSCVVPFICAIPLLTGGSVGSVMNYGSLFFTSISNLFAPFLIYIYLDKRQSDETIAKLAQYEEDADDDGGSKVIEKIVTNLSKSELGSSMGRLKVSGSNAFLKGGSMGGSNFGGSRAKLAGSLISSAKVSQVDVANGQSKTSMTSLGKKDITKTSKTSVISVESNFRKVIATKSISNAPTSFSQSSVELGQGWSPPTTKKLNPIKMGGVKSDPTLLNQSIPAIDIEDVDEGTEDQNSSKSIAIPSIAVINPSVEVFKEQDDDEAEIDESEDKEESLLNDEAVIRINKPAVLPSLAAPKSNDSRKSSTEASKLQVAPTPAPAARKTPKNLPPGFYIDPYYDDRVQVFSNYPTIDESVLNQIPEGHKLYQALPGYNSLQAAYFGFWCTVVLVIFAVISLFITGN